MDGSLNSGIIEQKTESILGRTFSVHGFFERMLTELLELAQFSRPV